MKLVGKIYDLARHFIVFCGVGAINTILSLLVILVLLEGVGLHYALANFLGYVFGLAIGFFLHSRITFRPGRGDEKHGIKHIRQFVVVFGGAYVCQLAFLYVLVEIVSINDVIAQILAVGMYTGLNFLGNKYWTFR